MAIPIIKLGEVAGGALQEAFDEAMADVAGNMLDPNTPWKKKRSVTVKLEFSLDQWRESAVCDITVEKKLAAASPIATKFGIGEDLRYGRVCMEEYGNQVRGQMSFEDYVAEEVIDGNVVDTDTGEVLGKVTGFPKKEMQG